MSLPTFADAAGEAAWRAAVARVMAKEGTSELWPVLTDDGAAIAPLYPKSEGDSPQPRREPGPCRIIQRIDHPDPFEARDLALADLEGGADGLVIAFEGAAAARGFGLRVRTAEDLNQTLGDVYLDTVSLRLEPAPGVVVGGLQVAELIERRGLAPEALDVDFGFDPVGDFAARGGQPTNWKDQEGAVMRTCATLRERGFASPLLRADGRPYSEAGATEAEELASVVATGVAYLRALERAGLLQNNAGDSLSFVLAADPEPLTATAKLRALRRLWVLVEESCSIDSAPVRLHAETSWRTLARRDAYCNLLRGALGCAAAMIGGADSVTVLPFTAAIGLPDAFARRLARNTSVILADESFLTRVVDPTAGSGAIEDMTISLCEKAWELFQKIETAGGFPKAVASGFWQDALSVSRMRRRHDLAARARPITGVSIFPNLSEVAPMVLSQRRPARRDRTGHGALPSERDAEPFERLRERSDAWLATHGARPKIFLATLAADASASRARDFARGVFEAGGFEISGGEAFEDASALAGACVASGALAACLCLNDAPQSDASVAAAAGAGGGAGASERAEAAARRLVGAGVRAVVAGWPGAREADLRGSGVEDFVFRGADAVSFLQRIWDRKTRP